MQKSWSILIKSVSVVLNNADQAFKLSGAIFVVAVFLSTALNVALTGSLIVNPPEFPTMEPGTLPEQIVFSQEDTLASLALLGGNFIFLVAMSWISVSWHRFVLLEEISDHLFPQWTVKRVLKYLWLAFLAAFGLAFAVVIPFMVIFGFVASIGLGALIPIVSLLMLVCFYYLFFRIGLILPATALDQPMAASQSFHCTRDISNEIWGVAALVVIVSLLSALAVGLIAPNNILGVLITSIVQWFMVMISASLLTTFYGHAVEHRQL
jgi:hypothetical protein